MIEMAHGILKARWFERPSNKYDCKKRERLRPSKSSQVHVKSSQVHVKLKVTMLRHAPTVTEEESNQRKRGRRQVKKVEKAKQ